MTRVTILLGKGGTGRTTLARALALEHARRGPAALLHGDPNTRVPDRHVDNDDLRVRVLNPYEIIEDAMARLIPLGPVTRTLVRHPAYESFLEVAPGIKEAAVLNFVYGFLRRREDHVYLDGPATGHGLHFLEAPAKLQRLLTGKVAARMANVHDMLRDPEMTRVVLVALPEELPALEVTELAQTLETEGFPVSHLVVNKVPPPVPLDTGQPPEAMPVPPPGREGWGIEPDEALALLKAERTEAEGWLEELSATGLPTTLVPSLPGRERLAEEVAPFVEGLVDALEERSGAGMHQDGREGDAS